MRNFNLQHLCYAPCIAAPIGALSAYLSFGASLAFVGALMGAMASPFIYIVALTIIESDYLVRPTVIAFFICGLAGGFAAGPAGALFCSLLGALLTCVGVLVYDTFTGGKMFTRARLLRRERERERINRL